MDQSTLLAAPTFDPLLTLPLSVLLAPAEAAVPVEPPNVSEETPWPAHSALYATGGMIYEYGGMIGWI